jgi:hypothetical protein
MRLTMLSIIAAADREAILGIARVARATVKPPIAAPPTRTAT